MRKRARIKKLGAALLALAGIVSIPEVRDGLGDVGDWVGDNALAAVLLFGALALLIWGYWDDLLRLFGFHTPASVRRRIRDWLDDQNYIVQTRPSAEIDFVAREQNDNVAVNIFLDVERQLVNFAAGVNFAPEHQPLLEQAQPARRRAFDLALTQLRLLAPRTSLLVMPDERELIRVTFIHHLPFRELSYMRFTDALYLVRTCHTVAQLMMQNVVFDVQESFEEDNDAEDQPQLDLTVDATPPEVITAMEDS